MFYSKYPVDWLPDIDMFGHISNEPDFEVPDSTIFLKSSLQGDQVDSADKESKQFTVRIPYSLYCDIEALSKSGSLNRNSVVVSLLSTGVSFLGQNLHDDTITRLNRLSREIMNDLKKDDDSDV